MRRTLGFSCFMSVFLAADDVERDVREAFSLLSSIRSKGDFVGRSCGFHVSFLEIKKNKCFTSSFAKTIRSSS